MSIKISNGVKTKIVNLSPYQQNKLKNINFKKFLFIFVVSATSIFILILISGLIIAQKNPNQLLANSALAEFIKKDTSPQYTIKEHVIESGEVFIKLNTALGLSKEQLQKILNISENAYSLVEIRAGNKIRSFFNINTNEFEKLEYEINQDNFLIVEKLETGDLKAEKRAIVYEIKLTKVSAQVEESLYQTGQSIGLADKIIMEMADIFAWDIDFGFDIRKGDEFELLYEKRYLNGQEVSPGKILIARFQNQKEDHWGIYYKDFEDREDYYNLEGDCLRRQFLKAPINYRYISSGYSLSRYHPVWNIYTTHRAIDYAAFCGTPVSASGAGTIIFAGWKNNVYGYTVEIRHNGVYTTRYGHLSAFGKGIRYGAKVIQGQTIAFVGTTGTSTGCHLDYSMKKYGSFINPLTQNFERSDSIKDIYKEDFEFNKKILIELLTGD